MKTMTFDAWANLVINGQESGNRQPCQLTIEIESGGARMAIDRELSFAAGRSGMASMVFFAEEDGDRRLMELEAKQATDTGWTFSVVPGLVNPLAG